MGSIYRTAGSGQSGSPRLHRAKSKISVNYRLKLFFLNFELFISDEPILMQALHPKKICFRITYFHPSKIVAQWLAVFGYYHSNRIKKISKTFRLGFPEPFAQTDNKKGGYAYIQYDESRVNLISDVFFRWALHGFHKISSYH